MRTKLVSDRVTTLLKTARRAGGNGLCGLAVLMFAGQPTRAASYGTGKSKLKSEPGAEIFDNRHVLRLRIDLAPDEPKAMQQDNRKFVRATVSEGTNVWKEVGIRVKGAAGSTRDASGLQPPVSGLLMTSAPWWKKSCAISASGTARHCRPRPAPRRTRTPGHGPANRATTWTPCPTTKTS